MKTKIALALSGASCGLLLLTLQMPLWLKTIAVIALMVSTTYLVVETYKTVKSTKK